MPDATPGALARVAAPAIPRSKRQDYGTGPNEVALAVAILRVIDLDPCSNPASLVPARRKIMLPEDGLAICWDGLNVYCNPPFDEMKAWTWKATVSVGGQVLYLIPAKPGTVSWQRDVCQADAVCFFKGRLIFQGEEQGIRTDCAFVYFGPDVARFISIMQGRGTFWFPKLDRAMSRRMIIMNKNLEKNFVRAQLCAELDRVCLFLQAAPDADWTIGQLLKAAGSDRSDAILSAKCHALASILHGLAPEVSIYGEGKKRKRKVAPVVETTAAEASEATEDGDGDAAPKPGRKVSAQGKPPKMMPKPKKTRTKKKAATNGAANGAATPPPVGEVGEVVMAHIAKHGPIGGEQMRVELNLSKNDFRKAIDTLKANQRIIQTGKLRGTKYQAVAG